MNYNQQSKTLLRNHFDLREFKFVDNLPGRVRVESSLFHCKKIENIKTYTKNLTSERTFDGCQLS